jgi:hypothetical protein
LNIKLAMVATVVEIMTLCLVATKPLNNPVFAACATDLTVKGDPSEGSAPPVTDVSGMLTCKGKGIHGASITLYGPGTMLEHATTDSSGHYDGKFHDLGRLCMWDN